jgi:uncharacterized membrane protein
VKLTREEIHALGSFSDLPPEKCDELLQNEVFAQSNEWKKFLKLMLLTIGVGFLIGGVIFFFAYNWEDLPKYTKLGVTQALIPIGIVAYLFTKGHTVIRELGAITATVMVGVAFAVYGQIYQSGANDFDFFFNWCAMVAVWVVVTNSPAQWLVYIILLNTTLFTYYFQYAYNWHFEDLYGALFLLNGLLLFAFKLLSTKTSLVKVPNWFVIPLLLATVYYATVGISAGIFKTTNPFFGFFFIAVVFVYALGIYQGYKAQRILYLGAIYLSAMIIICAMIINATPSFNEGLLLLLSFFVIGSTTGIVMHFISLQKQWKNEQS